MLLTHELSHRNYLQRICIRFTFLLQFLPDTTPVIAHAGQKAPFALLPPTTAPVEAPQSISARNALPSLRTKPRIHAEVGRYRLRLAQSVEDREAACRLRFKVFNIELGEGLESSYETGLDTDHFDVFCEHLLVEDKIRLGALSALIGCNREVLPRMNLGYYSEQEFEFAPYEPLRRDILELGRASIDREHRTPEVLTLLWRGIAQYANDMGLRYLVGCSSLNSKDPAEGWQMYRELEHYRVSPEFETVPTACIRMSQRAAGRGHTAIAPTRRIRSPPNQGSQVIEDLSGHRRAHLRPAGVGPRVWHHRFSDSARSEDALARPRAIASWRR